MKIALNMGDRVSQEPQTKVSEAEILAAKRGDWTAQGNIDRAFMPLLTTLAGKRSSDPIKAAAYIEAGKAGLAKAVRKYKPTVGAARFPIFVVDFIQGAMADVDNEGKGFFARLLSRK